MATKKTTAPKTEKVKAVAPTTSEFADPAKVIPVKAAVQDNDARLKALFAEARDIVSGANKYFPKTPRGLKLAMTAIDMAETATERHMKINA